MKGQLAISILVVFILTACKQTEDSAQFEQWKAEIQAVEQDFNDMAQKEGLVKAFEFYAAPDGVIRRNNKVVKGKQAIADWYKADVRPGDTLSWSPTFIDVSTSGDLAYTYGDFVFTYADSLGNKKSSTGVFHTVWKRQKDGSWRFVWD